MKAGQELSNRTLYKLQDKILNGYNSDIRPVKSQNTVTEIQTDFSLLQVISMVFSFFITFLEKILNILIQDDNEETITLSGYLNLGWTDEGIQWDPSDFDNITDINVPTEKIWTPGFLF